ncbi:amino acid-binding protein [Candidatus Aerophobetes bacterium]|nr:amino acid-binding protein [Candidatus Aerophobetes bacterium]
MKINQISVFLENKIGRLAEVTKVLGSKGINIRALSIADTAEFGILRMIVSQPEEACSILEKSGFTVSKTEVIVVEIMDRPGGLAEVLEILAKACLNVEYLYAFVAPKGKNALVVLKIEKLTEVVELLRREKVKILTREEISKL